MNFSDFFSFFGDRDDSDNGKNEGDNDFIQMTHYDWGYYDGIGREENKGYSGDYNKGFQTGENDRKGLSED